MGNILVSLVNSELDMCNVQGENGPYACLISWCTLSKPRSYRPCFGPFPLMTSETEQSMPSTFQSLRVFGSRRQMDKKID